MITLTAELKMCVFLMSVLETPVGRKLRRGCSECVWLVLQDVGAAEVRLLILENVMLSPAQDVYLLAGTSILYKVLKIRQGTITGLTLQSRRFSVDFGNAIFFCATAGALKLFQFSIRLIPVYELFMTALILSVRHLRGKEMNKVEKYEFFLFKSLHMNEWFFFFGFFSSLSRVQTHRGGQHLILVSFFFFFNLLRLLSALLPL